MEKSELRGAVIEALTDPKTIETIADMISKKVIQIKQTPSNIEEELVKKHVIFAKKDSTTGQYLKGSDISDMINDFQDADIDIRPRVFGKALAADCVETKRSREGTLYFIEEVVEEITPDLIEKYAELPNLKKPKNDVETVADVVEKKGKKKAAQQEEEDDDDKEFDSREDLMDFLGSKTRSGLKTYIKEEEIDVKVLKDDDEDDIMEKIADALGYDEEDDDDDEDEDDDFEDNDQSGDDDDEEEEEDEDDDDEEDEDEEIDDEEDDDEIIEELESLKRKGLMKYIRDNDLDVKVTDEMDDLNIRIAILNELGIETETEEEDDEEEEIEINGAVLGQMSRKELKQFIEDQELEIKVKKKDSDITICTKILEALGLSEDEEEEEEEQEKPASKKDKKKSKKDKKDKKKKK